MPSPTANTSIIVPGNGRKFGAVVSLEVREYSNFADTVDLSQNTPPDLQTRMLGGNDVVTLSNINITTGQVKSLPTSGAPVFSNRVNGNVGEDKFLSKAGSVTRDFVVGGSEGDNINLSNSARGADWQNGQKGNDYIKGATSTVMSVLRGGSQQDVIEVGKNSKHVAIGDLDKDRIIADGQARVIARTDGENAVSNYQDADVITNFGNDDAVYIPGTELRDLQLNTFGGTTYISSSSFTNGTSGGKYIVGFEARTIADVEGYILGGRIFAGKKGDDAFAATKLEAFYNDPTFGAGGITSEGPIIV